MKRKTAAKAPVEESIVNKELFEALAALDRERGISQEYMIERLEAALLSAYKKEYHGNDNAVVTQLIDPVLDELDPIESSYCLLVSSAGMERELRETPHYAYALERQLPVTLRTFVSIDGRKQFEGTLTGYDAETVTVEENGNERQFTYKQIAKLVAFCEEEPEETPPSLQQSERNGQTS